MFKLIDGPRPTPITPDVATRFAAMKPARNDRVLNADRLRRLREERTNGRLRAPEWVYAVCDETGETYRVNGKHTSTMLAALPAEDLEATPLAALVSGYHCPTLADVAALYSTFDARVSVRSQRDVNRAVSASDPELAEVSARTMEALVSGVATALDFLRGNTSRGDMSPYDRARLQLTHKHFILEAAPHLVAVNGVFCLHRRGVTAAMFMASRKDATATDGRAPQWGFWKEVAEGTNPDPNAPSRRLQLFLLTTKTPGGNRRAGELRFSDTTETYSRCVRFLNNWRAGRCGPVRYSPSDDLVMPR